MNKIILVDKRENGKSLLDYLRRSSTHLSAIEIVVKSDILSSRKAFLATRFCFSTWNMPEFSAEELEEYLPLLEAVFYAAGDVGYFSEGFEARGVRIYNAKVENSVPVAEFVLGQVLLANKGYFQAHSIYRRGLWRLGFRRARAASNRKPGNMAARVGIIGFGAVGHLLSSMLRPFDLQVLVYDPYVSDSRILEAGAARATLDEIFSTCDVISNHLPNTNETQNLLDYECFSAMKPEATFVNTGRGHQVNEEGLAKALRECPSKSALLDVTKHEPPFPLSPLYRLQNVFLSPHIAGSQGNEIERLHRSALRQYEEHVQIHATPGSVTG